MRGFLIVLICLALLAQVAFVFSRSRGTDTPGDAPAGAPARVSGPGLAALLTISASEKTVNEDRPPKHGAETLRGAVTDADGAPAAGVTVLAAQRDTARWDVYRGPSSEKRWLGTTDSDGVFVFDTLPAAEYVVAAFSPEGFALGMAEVRSGQPVDIVLLLAGHFSLSGTLLDAAGAPVPEAHVYALYGNSGANGPWTYWPATTDDHGRFAFHRMNARPRALLALHDDRRSALLELDPNAATSGITLAFGQDGELAGYLTETQEKKPASRTRLILTEAVYGLESHTSFSGRAGAYEFPGLRPAVYHISMQSDRYVLPQPPGPIAIEPGSRTELEVFVERGARVRGAVVGEDPRQTIADQEVLLVPENAALPEMTATTGATGVYQFSPVPQGRYRIVLADAAGALIEGTADIEVTGEKPITGPTYQVQPGVAVLGTVSTSSREPASGAIVFVRSDSLRGFERMATTDATGAFAFEDVPVGEPVRIWAELLERSSTPYVSKGVPASGIASLAFSLTLNNTSRIAGVVTNSQGVPIPGASVVCTPEQLSTTDRWITTTGIDGTFVFDRLTEGAYGLLAGADAAQLDESTQRRVSIGAGQHSDGVTMMLPL